MRTPFIKQQQKKKHYWIIKENQFYGIVDEKNLLN